MASGVEGILGRKVGMTQVFREDGEIVPVTVLQAGPCVVVGRKTQEKDGYEAVQLGLVEKFSKSKMTKPLRGFYDKAKVAADELWLGLQQPHVAELYSPPRLCPTAE